MSDCCSCEYKENHVHIMADMGGLVQELELYKETIEVIAEDLCADGCPACDNDKELLKEIGCDYEEATSKCSKKPLDCIVFQYKKQAKENILKRNNLPEGSNDE